VVGEELEKAMGIKYPKERSKEQRVRAQGATLEALVDGLRQL